MPKPDEKLEQMVDPYLPHNWLKPIVGPTIADPLGLGDSGGQAPTPAQIIQSQGSNAPQIPQATREAGQRAIDMQTTPFISEARMQEKKAYPDDMIAKLAQMLADQQRMNAAPPMFEGY